MPVGGMLVNHIKRSLYVLIDGAISVGSEVQRLLSVADVQRSDDRNEGAKMPS